MGRYQNDRLRKSKFSASSFQQADNGSLHTSQVPDLHGGLPPSWIQEKLSSSHGGLEQEKYESKSKNWQLKWQGPSVEFLRDGSPFLWTIAGIFS